MIDLSDVHAEWLVQYVKKTRDFSPLAAHLESNGEVTNKLKSLLAQILNGHLKPTRRAKTLARITMPGMLRAELRFWIDEFRFHAHNPRLSQRGQSGAYADWSKLAAILSGAGYRGVPETVGECRNAARQIVCWRHGLTPSMLDELLAPRKARPRKIC